MPDYGDDRGFRSRGVPADIGSDRMGGVDRMGGGYDRPFDRTVTTTDLMSGPPSNIGRDRAGGFGWNDFRQLAPNMNQFNNLKDRLRNFDELPSYPNLLDKLRNFDEEKIYQPAMDSGSYLASKFGGGLDDVAGMNESARGMIEDAGFDVAGGPGMVDKRMTDKLWGRAVNKFPPGTPDMIIQQEWERLKQIYFDKTYGGGQGLTLPGRDDIVGLS